METKFATDQSMPQINTEMQEEIMRSVTETCETLTSAEVEYREMMDKHLISLDKDYPPKEFVISIKGVPTITKGDIHMVQAWAKQGKTSVITLIVSAIVNGRMGDIAYILDDDPRVEVFDTEQFEADTVRQYKAVLELSGLEEEDLDTLRFHNLRSADLEGRCRFVMDEIRHFRPTLAVIDGVRDLVADINDPLGCPAIVQELMMLASEVGCALLLVLHNNPSAEKARGWLGTEISNKCAYSFEPRKEGQVVTVKNVVSRGAPVPDFCFTFDPYGRPISEGEVLQDAISEKQATKMQKKAQMEAEKEKQHMDIVMGILRVEDGLLTRSELVQCIADMNIKGFGRTTAYDFITKKIAQPDSPFDEKDGKMVIKMPSKAPF